MRYGAAALRVHEQYVLLESPICQCCGTLIVLEFLTNLVFFILCAQEFSRQENI